MIEIGIEGEPQYVFMSNSRRIQAPFVDKMIVDILKIVREIKKEEETFIYFGWMGNTVSRCSSAKISEQFSKTNYCYNYT